MAVALSSTIASTFSFSFHSVEKDCGTTPRIAAVRGQDVVFRLAIDRREMRDVLVLESGISHLEGIQVGHHERARRWSCRSGPRSASRPGRPRSPRSCAGPRTGSSRPGRAWCPSTSNSFRQFMPAARMSGSWSSSALTAMYSLTALRIARSLRRPTGVRLLRAAHTPLGGVIRDRLGCLTQLLEALLDHLDTVLLLDVLDALRLPPVEALEDRILLALAWQDGPGRPATWSV